MRSARTDMVTAAEADVEEIDVVGMDAGEQSGGGAAGNPLLMVHALLRGRYHWAVVLGLALAGAGAFVGYKATVPVYQSQGVIRIKPKLPRILRDTEQSVVMPMYEAFLQSQVSIARNERVINGAMQNPAWKAIGRPMSPEQFAEFSESLRVEHPKSSELLVVSFTDADPNAAMAAVKSVTEAYERVYKELDFDGQTQQILENLKEKLGAELSAKESAILRIAPFGATAMQDMYRPKLEELAEYEAKLRDLDMQIAAADARARGVAAVEPAATQPASQLAPEAIARTDRRMAELILQARQAERNLERLQRRTGPKNAQVEEAKAELSAAREDVESYAADFNRIASSPSGAPGLDPLAVANLPALRTERQNVAALHEQVKTQVEQFGVKATQVQLMTAEADQLRKDLDQAERDLQGMELQSTGGGRIDVLSRGDRPIAPAKDRRLALGAGGGAGGFAAGVGLVALIGLMDRRVKYTSDAERMRRNTRLLGILPHLPEDMSDPQSLAVAASCVHHIRGRLQIHHDAMGHRVLAVTSPSSGDGKTTLLLALGLSFAASRSRTLLIDFDMVGGGLTTRTNAIVRRRIGQLLVRGGVVRPEQLEKALDASQRSGRRLGDAVVDLGYADRAAVDAALESQREAKMGLLDVLAGDPLDDCIAPTGVPNLSILPLGDARPRDVVQLSPATISRILSEARAKFDTILIDTGPVLGSLEASLVASQVDQVALVVSRGEQRPLAERAMEVLSSSGASLAGIVFNRAADDEVLAIGHGSSGRMSVAAVEGAGKPDEPSSNSRMGALAAAVGYRN